MMNSQAWSKVLSRNGGKNTEIKNQHLQVERAYDTDFEDKNINAFNKNSVKLLTCEKLE